MGSAAAGVPLLLLTLFMDHILKRESMGGGDIKFFFAVGLFFSWREILFLMIISCVLGIVFTLTLKKTTNDPTNPGAFPFGPAISAGTFIALLVAQPVMAAYFNLFI